MKSRIVDRGVQQLACFADKWPPQFVLGVSRTFADENQRRTDIALTKNDVCAALGERTTHALARFRLEFEQRFYGVSLGA